MIHVKRLPSKSIAAAFMLLAITTMLFLLRDSNAFGKTSSQPNPVVDERTQVAVEVSRLIDFWDGAPMEVLARLPGVPVPIWSRIYVSFLRTTDFGPPTASEKGTVDPKQRRRPVIPVRGQALLELGRVYERMEMWQDAWAAYELFLREYPYVDKALDVAGRMRAMRDLFGVNQHRSIPYPPIPQGSSTDTNGADDLPKQRMFLLPDRVRRP